MFIKYVPNVTICGETKHCVTSHIILMLCGLVVRVSGYRYRGPGFDPGATRFSEY